jgi:hypothetical protein
MTYEDFVKKLEQDMPHETIYQDSEGRRIVVITLLDLYWVCQKLGEREMTTMRLTVTTDSGGTVDPSLTYDHTCSCRTKTQFAKISGFGTPEGRPRSLLLETPDEFTDECSVCGKTNRIVTTISAVPEHELERVK